MAELTPAKRIFLVVWIALMIVIFLQFGLSVGDFAYEGF